MQLSDYAHVLRRWWWVILLVVFVTVGSGYAFSKIPQPLYRSEATYLVIPSRNDNGLSIVLQDSMNSYRELALAPEQLEKISAALKLDRSADWLLNKHVAIQPLPDDRKMIVQVNYPDADVAPRLANAIGENMIGLVASLPIEGTDRISITKLQSARPPVQSWPPRASVTVPVGSLLGLMLGALVAFGLEALDNSLKTPADVERFVGLTTLGTIPTVSE
jgi:capsular polysaccharide biosynthesis protein